MRFGLRKTLRFGPVRIHLTQRGVSSWGLQVGRWTWNAKSGKHTVDTPGPGYLQTRGRGAVRRPRCGQQLASQSGARGHMCAVPGGDGHTMHRCRRGCCQWGHL